MREFVVRFLVVGGAIVLYYRFVVGLLGSLSRPLARVLRLGRRYPLRDVSAAVNLPVAAIGQALFSVVLLRLTGVDPLSLFASGFHPALPLYGLILGAAEMAVATFLCRAAMQAAARLSKRPGPADQGSWQVAAKGGWMRYHIKTLEVVPLPLALVSVLLYVSVEEVVFRGVVLTYLAPAGAPLALAASVFLFVLVQVFHMPDWRSAMFPVIGSLVLGVVHGSLFVAVPTVVPLIVAHLVFFIAAVI